MILLREVTDWEWPNHDYLLHKDKMVAYRKVGGDDWEKYKKPLWFSRSRRKFIELQEDIPTKFITPRSADVEASREHYSLEYFL